ncbi:hypothetical protein JCM15764A_17750 [Geotalea toluenoxydans]
MLYRGIEKLLNLGKINNFVELPPDLFPLHSQDGTIQKNVFTAGQFLMKACSHFQQARYPPFDPYAPCRWFRYAGEYLEECGFTGAVTAYYTDSVPLPNFE